MLYFLNPEQLKEVRAGKVLTVRNSGTYRFRLIPASEARNTDGSLAGWDRSDQRMAIEVKFHPKGGDKPRYSNVWGQEKFVNRGDN